jgi:hypothetical protein
MTASNTKIGSGLTLTWDSQTVAQLNKIGKAGFQVEKLDVTVFSTASNAEAVAPGLVKSIDIAISGNLGADDTNGQVAMFADAKARTSCSFTITYPSTLGTVTFAATGFLSECWIGDATPAGIVPFEAVITCNLGTASLGA